MGWSLQALNCTPLTLEAELLIAAATAKTSNPTKVAQITAAITLIQSVLKNPRTNTYSGTTISIGIMDTGA